MKITFFSNFLNHHQTPFCNQMIKMANVNFTFVSTIDTPVEFLRAGYTDYSSLSYNLRAYRSDEELKIAMRLGLDSDIVIIGSASDIFIKERLAQNKLTFRYSERLLKKSTWQLLDPRVLISLFKNHTIYRNKNLHMLCASAYTANDLNLVLAYPNKKYKWGYFTEIPQIDIESVIAKKGINKVELLWTARFLHWKHPELAVKLALLLKQKGYSFHLNMIGGGDMFQEVNQLIVDLELTDCVSLLGNMPNDKVKDYMLKSNIFIFTSDRNEGWGAVLNEAMSCGCAVVASDKIGSVPFLLKNGENGLIFESLKLESLLFQTEKLFNDKFLRNSLGVNAYFTILNEWSPSVATKRFIKLINSILSKECIIEEDGPCSEAKYIISNFWK